jgi:hypothetical protein
MNKRYAFLFAAICTLFWSVGARAQLANPKVQVIFWGSEYVGSPRVAATMTLVRDLVTGSFMGGAQQYGIHTGTVIDIGSPIVLTTPTPPATINHSGVRTLLTGWLQSGAVTPVPQVNESSVMYLIMPPTNKTLTPYFCDCDTPTPGFQGIHWNDKYNAASTQNDLIYAMVKTYDQTNPFTFASNLAPDIAHELIEAFNDPIGGRLELGDPCEGDSYTYVGPSSASYGVDQYWSVGDNYCWQPSKFAPLLPLIGWTGSTFSTAAPEMSVTFGIVQLRGGMSSTGANSTTFRLPPGYAPTTKVYVPADLANGNFGRLIIGPAGDVLVQGQGGNLADAETFTSLEGVSFAIDATGFTALALQNGWTDTTFGTRHPAVKYDSDAGIIRFEGAMSTAGTNMLAFTLPFTFAPSSAVFVPAGLCSASKGRLNIQPDGTVSVTEFDGQFSEAQCFTSLEGVTFAFDAFGSTALTPSNGWSGTTPWSTRPPAVTLTNGVVHFQGAVRGGSSTTLFTLPSAFIPKSDVYVTVALCSSLGRLYINSKTGAVSVQMANSDPFSDAQCLTSLEGASYAL